MGFGQDLSDLLGRPRNGYFESSFDANSTNGNHDVRVTSVVELQNDLCEIGWVYRDDNSSPQEFF